MVEYIDVCTPEFVEIVLVSKETFCYENASHVCNGTFSVLFPDMQYKNTVYGSKEGKGSHHLL
jgi:hypothetical protein